MEPLGKRTSSNSSIPQTNISYSTWQTNSSEVVHVAEDGTKVGSIISWNKPTSTESVAVPIASSPSPTRGKTPQASLSTIPTANSNNGTSRIILKPQKTMALLPKLSIRQSKSYRCIFLSGPYVSDETEATTVSSDAIAARSVSLYPLMPVPNSTTTQRQGGPISDGYSVAVNESNVAVVAIGSGLFGEAGQKACRIATKSFVSSLMKVLPTLHKLKYFNEAITNAFIESQKAILKDEEREAGNTSLCGGVLVRIGVDVDLRKAMQVYMSEGDSGGTHGNSSEPSDLWAFIGGAIGKERVFHFSTAKRHLTELSSITKSKSSYLGSNIGDIEFTSDDVRNVFCYCEPDDLIIVVTDGVWANLDPLNTKPSTSFGFETWDDPAFAQEEQQEVRDQEVVNTLKSLIMQSAGLSFSPADIVDKISQYCLKITSAQRDWIEHNPGSRISASEEFTGKMDHSTSLVVKVGKSAFISEQGETEDLWRSLEIVPKKSRKRESIPIEEIQADVTPPPTERERGSTFIDLLQLAVNAATRSSVYQNLPNKKVSRNCLNPYRLRSTLIMGPKLHKTEPQYFGNVYCCHSISTYPHLRGNPMRSGDPICDSYGLYLQENGLAIAVVADGCNWGKQPQIAAKRAKKAFLEYTIRRQHLLTDVIEVGHVLLLALKAAHEAILDGKLPTEDRQLGTTTLLGGILVELEQEDPNDSRYGFIATSVGDCKAYKYSVKDGSTTDITPSSRSDVNDPMDPGGRLGPTLSNDQPDLRNLSFYFCPCDIGDMIFMSSDGVYDNLDPQMLGYTPNEMKIDAPDWHSAPYDQVQLVKENFLPEFMRRNITNVESNTGVPLSPRVVVKRLLNHCRNTTQSSRDFMIDFPGKRLPGDYKKYPGKMDHTTCVGFTVGASLKY